MRLTYYDDLDRLTQADYIDSTDEVFTYDDLGNRLTVNTRSDQDVAYVPNVANEYTSIGGQSVSHDAAGNLSADADGYTYQYDHDNRLTKIKDSSTATVAEFTYDALGRRIEKIDSAAGTTTRYYYDGWRVLSETDEDGDLLRSYTYGNYLDETLILTDASSNDYYYAHNHLYSPVALMEDDGDVVERYEYDVYGKPYFYNSTLTALLDPQKSTKNNPVMFTGQRLDNLNSENLCLMNYKNRIYRTDTGRFLQRDPLGVNPNAQRPNRFAVHDQYKDGMCLYEYVMSEPTCNTDPYGKFLKKIWNKFVCCKLKKTHRIPGFWTKTHGIFRSYYVPPMTVTSCSLNTIRNPRGLNPMSACKCAFESGDTKVKGARPGICCICNLYMDKTGDRFLGKTHPFLKVVCSDGKGWSIDAPGPGKDWLDFKKHPGQKPSIYEVGVMRITSDRNFHKFEYVGHVSCKDAQEYISELYTFIYTYEQPHRECNYWANRWHKELTDKFCSD